jgi:DNA-binding MarR family transcriptional regulator
LVRKRYVERLPDPDDGRAVSLRATRSGRALYERINGELIDQQADLLRDLDPEVRAGAAEVIRRLAKAAQARFIDGSSAAASACCGPGEGA